MVDYYTLLGIDRCASQKEIKEAFRKQALLYHPDMHSNSSKTAQDAATAKFREISDAYHILSQEKSRAVYDRYGRTAASQSEASSAGSYQTYQTRWYDEPFEDWARYQRTRTRHQSFMRWKDFSKRFGRFLALQTFVSSMIIVVLLTWGSATTAAWDHHNRGKSFEDVMNQKYSRERKPKDSERG